ncbi:hypothetical protein PDG61_25520 [Mycolicibacterium sp. BiH015]|uniref:hypothetical protein n=1 Tax=Mycolicibacterium sp. BiH015 TaxID=3018808 RepID=UPI0022E4EECC|nr:hypothetical protein [Mycolicibacterium sp. BiH015]MDA2894292.1 hypothetical protein [Mycolicibacterium sp. BiH015]
MFKRILIVAVTIALVAILGVTAYSRLYLPTTRPILNGAPLVLPGKLEKLSADPLGSQPQADRQRFGVAMHDAVSAIAPDYRIETEELYVRRTGYDWVALEKMASPYLDQYGLTLAEQGQEQVGGETVDYLMWRPEWLRSIVDDRIVLAVALRTLLEPDYGTMIFGYFVLRPR